jgi:hypothetical protein
MVEFMFTDVMDMPTDYFNSIRGRGGLGSSTQKLVDVFWQMTTDTTGGTALQALLKFYVAVTAATTKTDADFNVAYGFPMNTYSAIDAASAISNNDGALALSTGLKLYVAATAVPVADYFGFFVLRMTPFYKTTGANEIVTVVNSDRTV